MSGWLSDVVDDHLIAVYEVTLSRGRCHMAPGKTTTFGEFARDDID